MTIIDWFDPYDYAHIRAYRELERTGAFPEDVLPPYMELERPPAWQVSVIAKMGSAWMDAMEKGLIKVWDNPASEV